MISVCTVMDQLHRPYYDCFIKSLLKKQCMVKEVIVAHISKYPSNFETTEYVNGVLIRSFDLYIPYLPDQISYKHSIGLHHCINRVQSEYIILSDCDILFYKPKFDAFYLETYEKNDLNILGIQMYKITGVPNFVNSYGNFPSIHNCFIKTNTLPPPEMFAGRMRWNCGVGSVFDINKTTPMEENYYLSLGAIPEWTKFYPNPTGYFDTGCKLYLWNYFNNGNWLSFIPGCGLAYTTNWDSNIRDKISFHSPEEILLYHHSGIWEKNPIGEFHMRFTESLEYDKSVVKFI